MASKRPSASENDSDTKRPKLDLEEYEVVLSDEVYVIIDRLFQHDLFKDYLKKHYKRSAIQFIEKESLQVLCVSQKSIESGILKQKPSYASGRDFRLVKKDERIEALLNNIKDNSLQPAPPIIKDKDLKFFVDKSGESYEVEMRGERMKDGIYFKVKDVGRVFQSERMSSTILDPRNSYKESIHFIWFKTSSHMKSSKQRAQSKEMFLTFEGFLHALRKTRSKVADEFREWVENQVFTLAFGTVKQKKEMISTLCKVDKTFLQAFMKLVPGDLSCIYLVDTTMTDGNSRVYKFGRSNNLKDRFFKHNVTYGAGTLLDSVIFIPADMLSEAEALMNNSISEEERFQYDKAKELITLDSDGRKRIRRIMQTIADKYHGSMAIQASNHAKEVDQMKYMYDMRIKDLERMVDVLNERMKTEALRLEKCEERMKAVMKVEALRLENAKLKSDAKDRKIEELTRIIANLKERRW